MNSSDENSLAAYPRFEIPPPPLSIGRVVAIVLISTFSGGLVGGLIGFLMGLFLPDFYRSGMFGGGGVINPVQTGTGLGISEGLGLGFFLGALIVCVIAFGRRKPKVA